jgi:carboxyl-terminal processing protease
LSAEPGTEPAVAVAPPRRGSLLKRTILILLIPLSFYLGMVFEFHAGADIDQLIAPALFAAPVSGLDSGSLNQVFELMQRNYARAGLSPHDAFNAAAKGLVHNLLSPPPYRDDFSYYFTPEELNQNKQFLAGSFGGIGASMQVKNNLLSVTSITPGSPAQAADLHPNDAVTRIDGQDAAGLTVDQGVQKIRGKVGSHVRLTVSRSGKTLEFDIVRAQISVPSVRSKELAPGVFYIRIYDFGEHTGDDFDKQLGDALRRGDNSVLLDLRRNPGGFVSAADRVVSEFVQSGTTVTLVGRDSRDQHKVSGQGVAFTTKVVVLVDENSASASEIVAGALQDHHRAVLVGIKTFGKGLVEQDYPLRNGGDLHLTIAYWYRPSGKSINLVGITPDTTVTLATPQDLYEVADPSADPTHDAQLQAALAALK